MGQDRVFALCQCLNRCQRNGVVIRQAGFNSLFIYPQLLSRRIVNEGTSGRGVLVFVLVVRLLRLYVLQDRSALKNSVRCRRLLAFRA